MDGTYEGKGERPSDGMVEGISVRSWIEGARDEEGEHEGLKEGIKEGIMVGLLEGE